MITDFPKPKMYNPSGLKRFRFMPAEYVQQMEKPVGMAINNRPVFFGNMLWLNGYATYETLQFNEQGSADANGPSYQGIIKGIMPGDTPEIADLMDSMSDREFVVVISDFNNRQRIVGRPENGLIFSSSFASGERRFEGRGYQFQFLGNYARRAPFYTGT